MINCHIKIKQVKPGEPVISMAYSFEGDCATNAEAAQATELANNLDEFLAKVHAEMQKAGPATLIAGHASTSECFNKAVAKAVATLDGGWWRN